MRALLLITVGLNVVLALVLWRAPRAAVNLPQRSVRGAGAVAPPVAATFTNQRVVVVTGDDGSPWSVLAAGDFRACMERLRQAGCPEETIRDLIMAAVSRRHRAELVAREEQRARGFQWWRGIQDEDYDRGAAQETRSRRDLELAQLLGDGWRQDIYTMLGWKSDNSHWSFISQEKRSQLDLLAAKYTRLEDAVRKGARGSFLLEEDDARLKQLKLQQRAEQAQLLTPGELEDLEMRQSPAAYWVKQRLPEAASEEEYRQLVRAALASGKDQTSEQALIGGESPEEAVQRRAAEEKALHAQLKLVLGDVRYAELFPNVTPGEEPKPAPKPTFEESMEVSRQELVKLAQTEGVSPEAANAAHTRLVAIIKEFEKRFGNLDKPSEAQQEEISKAIKEKGEKIFTETMGEKGRVLFKRMTQDDE